MGPVKPLAQVGRGFVRGLTVERHHRGGHPGNPDDMRPPALFGDPRHFNDEGSSGNGFFETVPHDFYVSWNWLEKQHRFYAARTGKQAKESTKAASLGPFAMIRAES